MLRLFLETLADRENAKQKTLWANCIRSRQKLKTYLENDFTPPNFEQAFSIWKSISKLNARECKRIWNRFKAFRQNVSRQLQMIFVAPASIVHQGFFKKIDENCLHRQKLTGEKVFKQMNVKIFVCLLFIFETLAIDLFRLFVGVLKMMTI